MISIEEALRQVLEHARPGATQSVTLRLALGRTLAEDVASDVDSPPHDKSLVDGYAVRADDFSARSAEHGTVEMQLLEEVTAGALPAEEVRTGCTTRVMTGAPLPQGADAVVMIEHAQWRAEPGVAQGVVQFSERIVTAGDNIMRQAASLRRGQVVLETGAVVSPAEIGLLAEVGRSDVHVFQKPSVAVLPTGDELVDVSVQPVAGRIRNSNGPMLAACAQQAGAEVVNLGIGRDDSEQLAELIAAGLRRDILLISGGVSAGVKDLVPGVLAELGVERVFHKVQLKPGKPIWFGVKRARPDSVGEALVFGLPGNPVSSLVCFHLFVRPAIERLGGCESAMPNLIKAILNRPHDHRSNRITYWPAQVAWMDGQPSVDLIAWRGSSDLRPLTESNALAILDAGQKTYEAGESVTCHMLA